jgi:hypothetical protein
MVVSVLIPEFCHGHYSQLATETPELAAKEPQWHSAISYKAETKPLSRATFQKCNLPKDIQ